MKILILYTVVEDIIGLLSYWGEYDMEFICGKSLCCETV